MADAGLLHRALLSHDAGWYRPGAQSQDDFRGYAYVFEKFLPRLRTDGFSMADIDQLMIANPAAALVGP